MHFLERKLILVTLQFQFLFVLHVYIKGAPDIIFLDTNKVLFENIEAFNS